MIKLLVLALCVVLVVPVDAKEHRSWKERAAFVKAHPCPSTGKTYGSCPGYIVDHVVPIACGGPDLPSNMQWQTVAEACAKDKWELQACGKQRDYRPGPGCE